MVGMSLPRGYAPPQAPFLEWGRAAGKDWGWPSGEGPQVGWGLEGGVVGMGYGA